MIFADTGFFFALFSERDRHHDRVVEVFKSFQGRRLPDEILTTNLVVLETITLARERVSHAAAIFAGERLYSEKSPASTTRRPRSSSPVSSTRRSTATRSTAPSTASASW